MNIYFYKDNGEYNGQGTADIDPLVHGNYLIPAYTTSKAPPSKEANKVRRFIITGEFVENEGIKGHWENVKDLRGTKAYNTSNGSQVVIEYMGELKEGHTLLVPKQYQTWDGTKWVDRALTEEEITLAINSEYDVVDRETEQNILAGFTYDGKVFSMSPSAQSNWLFLLNELDMGRFPDKWEIAVKDDTDYELTKAKAPAFFKACAIHKETTLKKGRVKKQAVRAKYGR